MKNVQTQVDATLRALAKVSVPKGLAERVEKRLAAEQRVIPWTRSVWMQQVAAAVLCAAVIGGAYGLYWLMPHPGTGAHAVSGFTQAGAVRKPQPDTVPILKTEEVKGRHSKAKVVDKQIVEKQH